MNIIGPNLSEDDTSMYETVFDLINWYEEIYDDSRKKSYCNHRIHSGCGRYKKIINKLEEGCESCFSVVPHCSHHMN